MQMCVFCLLSSCFRADMVRYGHAGTGNGESVGYKCRTELRTLQTQDTSHPEHFGTSWVDPNCPDRSALVPKCPKDSSDLSAKLSCFKCRTVLSIQCNQPSAIAAVLPPCQSSYIWQHAHRWHGYWTTRRYANSRIVNSRTGRLADWTSRGLVNSRTRQLAYWTSRGLDNSRMPSATLHA